MDSKYVGPIVLYYHCQNQYIMKRGTLLFTVGNGRKGVNLHLHQYELNELLRTHSCGQVTGSIHYVVSILCLFKETALSM